MNGHHQKHCLIMDNCIMADQAKCKAIEKKMGTKLIFLPPCSAQINPIETWFQQLRLRIRKNSYNNDMDLFKTIHTLLF
jgi:transposase